MNVGILSYGMKKQTHIFHTCNFRIQCGKTNNKPSPKSPFLWVL